MKGLKLGDFEIFWLNGGEFELDGGTMFGVVPKVLWAKKYPAAAWGSLGQKDNYIRLLNYPLLIKTSACIVLVETGLGNKLTKKQKEIYRVVKEWDLPGDLHKLGLKRQDVDYVLLTHCDFDHAGGIVMKNETGGEELTFPNARHIVQKSEWEDAMHPDIRSKNSYWPQNFSQLQGTEKLQLVEGNLNVCDGVAVEHTGGHTRGHQVVRIQSGDDIAYHLADLLPTHVHFNPQWIMAYDNFPMDAISLKQKYEARGIRENAWFTFYHDPSMYACKFDDQGRVLKQFGQQADQKHAAEKKDFPVQHINVGKNKRVILSCPDCLVVREIPVHKFMGKKHLLTVNCPCGTTFSIDLDFRRYYRKNVSLGGYYTKADSDICWTDTDSPDTIPINCRIKNISMGGFGFTALNRVRVQVGDLLKVKFTLDKIVPEIIEKKVVVRTILDNYIGCEFLEESGYNDRTLGFYLMR